MRKLLLLGFLAVVLLLPASLSAQSDTPAPACTPDDLTAALDAAEVAIAAIREAAPDDLAAALDLLRGLRGDLAAADAACQGWSWSGENQDAVFGPFTLNPGLYVVTYAATSDSEYGGVFSASFENAAENEYIESPFGSPQPDSLIEGTMTIRVDGGTYLLDVSALNTAWTLSLARP